MKIKVQYGYNNCKSFILDGYNSRQEKEVLLLSLYRDITKDDVLDSILEIFDFKYDISELSTLEKKILLLYYRSNCIGDTLDIKFTCPHCKKPNENNGTFTINIKNPTKQSDLIIDRYTIRTPQNTYDFFTDDINDLDYDEFEKLSANLDDYITTFDVKLKVTCQHCRKEVMVPRILETDFIVKMLSEYNVSSYYRSYNNLIFFGRWNKFDIDNLYPFERTLFTNLLTESKQEQTKTQQKSRPQMMRRPR